MPRVAISQEYKTSDGAADFPPLKLNVAEKARICLPEEPWMEWYHRIEAPLIEHGEPVMEVRERKNGSSFEAYKMDWIGSAFCLGVTGTPDSPGPLMESGIDPANCPICEAAAKGLGVSGPEQRFAFPVIKYKVRSGTWDLIAPVSAEILIWPVTARVYGDLVQIQAEYGALRKVDIKLECESTPGADKWQRMKKIGVVVADGRAVSALSDQRVAAYVRELWVEHPENRPTDEQLKAACKGRDYQRPVIADMVRRAERQWAQASQAGSGASPATQADGAFNGADLAAGLDSLLEPSPAAGNGQAPAAGDDPFGATGATTTGTSAPAAASPSPTEPRSAPGAPASDDPFAGLGEPETVPAEHVNGDAAREAAVNQAADDMFGAQPAASPPPAAPAPAANGRGRKGKAAETPEAAAEVPSPAPAAASVPAAGGAVLDFDDLFKD